MNGLVWVDEPGPCIGCLGETWKALGDGEPWSYWHDLCWQRDRHACREQVAL